MYDGRQKVHSATVASGGTSSGEIDLGGYYDRVTLEIPASISGNVRLQAAHKSGGTFRQVYTGYPDNDTSPSILSLNSAICNCVVAVPSAGRFLKVELSTATTVGLTFYLTTFG